MCWRAIVSRSLPRSCDGMAVIWCIMSHGWNGNSHAQALAWPLFQCVFFGDACVDAFNTGRCVHRAATCDAPFVIAHGHGFGDDEQVDFCAPATQCVAPGRCASS